MVAAKDLKAGMTFLNGDKLLRVMEASHHKPGKGNTISLLTQSLLQENAAVYPMVLQRIK